MKNAYAVCLAIVAWACVVRAQSDVQFTHFMVNRMLYNPAFAGGKNVLDAAAIYRSQWWSGLDGAPRTFSIMAHAPLPQSPRHGVGVSLVADKIGLYQATLGGLYYAYRIDLKSDGSRALRLGVNLRFDSWRADWTQTRPFDLVDGRLDGAAERASRPNLGLGAYFTSGKFYAGLSAPLLWANPLYGDRSHFGIGLLSYYLVVGTEVPLSGSVVFHPNAMVSFNPRAPFELDLNASFLLREVLWLGASYRHGDSIDGLIGYEIGNGMRIGLSLDLTTSDLKQVTTGSFEFVLGYTFGCEDCEVHSLRHF